MSRRIILFELNEVPYRILEDYCNKHPKSAIAQTLPKCRVIRTYTEQTGDLSPWNTWPTLHRGVTPTQHGITEFGQALAEVDAAYPTLWRILADRGIPTGVFGSLHSYPPPTKQNGYVFYVPDTFAAGAECFPKSLEAAQQFTLDMVRRSARNVDGGLPWRGAWRLLRAAPDLGLKPRTFLEAGTQLLSERVKTARRVRRRTLQAVLAFDVFLKQLEVTRPAFTTCFTNHVASSMHRYWAATYPGDYAESGFDQEWTDTYRDEIDFAMERFDRCFERLVAFARRNPEYVIWVTGSMGQAATTALPLETQLFVTDEDRFAAAFGLASGDWSRANAMFPQYNLRVRGDRADAVNAKLERLQIDGSPLRFRQAEPGFFCLDFGHPNLYRRPQPVLVLDGTPLPIAELGLGNVEIEDKSGTTAYHIPQGMLIVFDPAARPIPWEGSSEISTLEIAPAILANFGVSALPHMKAPAKLLVS